MMFLAGNRPPDLVRAQALARIERDAGGGFAVLPRDPRYAIAHRGSVA